MAISYERCSSLRHPLHHSWPIKFSYLFYEGGQGHEGPKDPEGLESREGDGSGLAYPQLSNFNPQSLACQAYQSLTSNIKLLLIRSVVKTIRRKS